MHEQSQDPQGGVTHTQVNARLAAALAEWLTGELTRLESRIVNDPSTGIFDRIVVKRVWGKVMGEVPSLAASILQGVHDQLGGITLNEVAVWLSGGDALHRGNL